MILSELAEQICCTGCIRQCCISMTVSCLNFFFLIFCNCRCSSIANRIAIDANFCKCVIIQLISFSIRSSIFSSIIRRIDNTIIICVLRITLLCYICLIIVCSLLHGKLRYLSIRHRTCIILIAITVFFASRLINQTCS